MSDRLRAAAEAALEALTELEGYSRSAVADKIARDAKQVLRAALAEPECCCGEPTASGVVHRQDGPCYMAEPVAYIYEVRFTDKPDREWCYCGLYRSKAQVKSILDRTTDGDIEGRIVPLYVSPPRREWVSLTDDEINRVTDAQWARNNDKPIYAAHRAYARAVEAALREKNGG